MKSKSLNDCLEAEPRKPHFVKMKQLLNANKSTGIGYKDVKPYLYQFLKSIDKERLGIECIALYGSIARGTGHVRAETYPYWNGSDVNLLFITKNDLDYKMHNEIVEKANQYEDPLRDLGLHRFSIYTITEEEFNDFAKAEYDGIKRNGASRRGGFMYNVADEGIVLYDADCRITKYLKHMQEEPHQKNLIARGIVSEEIYPW